MVKTRGAHRRSGSARRSYRRRVGNSHCRGKGVATCRRAPGCKRATGRKRSYCRKTRNTKRHRGGTHGHHKSHPKHHKSHHAGSRGKKGRGVLSSAAVPFTLWGLKHANDKR